MISPSISEDGMVFFNKNGLNVKSIYGIEPTYYLKINEEVVKKGLKIRHSDAKIQISFVLYCHELVNMGFDLTNLISEFNVAQKSNLEEMSHALCLAKLCYHYKKAGFNIQVKKKKLI